MYIIRICFIIWGYRGCKNCGKLGGDKDRWDYLGATFSFTKNGKSKKAFVDAIISTDWNRKKYTSQVFKEFGSSLYSLFF